MKSTDELQQELTFLLTLPRNKDISVQISDIKKQLRNEEATHNDEGEELFRHLPHSAEGVFIDSKNDLPSRKGMKLKGRLREVEEEMMDEEEPI